MEKGYYLVKKYNHDTLQIYLFNGSRFEVFKNDEYIHDEIESYSRIDVNQEQLLRKGVENVNSIIVDKAA